MASYIVRPAPQEMARGMRLAGLVASLLAMSPLVWSPRVGLVRYGMFMGIAAMMALGVAASAILWATTFCGDATEAFEAFRYGFAGVFAKGMTLSPIAAVAGIMAGYIALTSGRHIVRILAAVYYIVAFLMCSAGSSRMSTMALLLSTMVVAWSSRAYIISVARRRWIWLLLLLGFSAPLVPTVVRTMVSKTRLAYNGGSPVFFSRDKLWNARLTEFESSPMIGIGYANELYSSNHVNGGVIDNNIEPGGMTAGSLEPGSSWLSILSYSGILGGATFLWFAFTLIARSRHILQSQKGRLALALLLFCILNGITEGWLLFAGGTVFPVFWLITSFIYYHEENKDYDCNRYI